MAAKFLLTRAGLDVLSPAMQDVSAGKFRMGDKDEKSAHEVSIVRPFKMGRYEVTFEEYDLFAALTERELPNDAGWGRGHRPVINVLWKNAKAYYEWLSKETGKRYRLPTEAEWEYAARSGGEDEIWAGTSDESQLKDYAVYGTDHTEPVGGKKPNGLGLYDMSGNVSEWVQNCYENGTDEDKCKLHVLRGWAWEHYPDLPGVSKRQHWGYPGFSYHGIGFRLAQDID